MIGDAVEIWIDLISEEKLSQYKDEILKRFKAAMTPCHFLANLTHPLYKGMKN